MGPQDELSCGLFCFRHIELYLTKRIQWQEKN